MFEFSLLEKILQATGELVEAEGIEVGLVVVGGASLNLLGFVVRTTDDVDIIAQVELTSIEEAIVLVPPDPLPEALQRAITRVARDFGLAPDWMNTEISAQWTRAFRRGYQTT